jgi:predicted NUDIX family phosphoesterase
VVQLVQTSPNSIAGYPRNLAGDLSYQGKLWTEGTTGSDRLGQMTEQVLVLPRNRVPGGCDFTALRVAGEAEMAELRQAVAEHGRYLDRPVAEESPEWKQLIPYVVVRDGERTFLMERTGAGGDARLHRKASIGVGGHLNPVDAGEDPLQGGLRREWAEELVADWEPQFNLLGLLNDDTNPVGSVHLGVVFQVDAADRPVRVRETDKLSGRMADAAEVAAAWERLETWSQLVAAALLGVPSGSSAG